MLTGFEARAAGVKYPLNVTVYKVTVGFTPGSTEPREWQQPMSISLSEVDYDEETGLTVVALIFIIIGCLCACGIAFCVIKACCCQDDKSSGYVSPSGMGNPSYNNNYSHPGSYAQGSYPSQGSYPAAQTNVAMAPMVPAYAATDPNAKQGYDQTNGGDVAYLSGQQLPNGNADGLHNRNGNNGSSYAVTPAFTPAPPAPWQSVPELDAAGQATGRTYYHNIETDEVSWDFPTHPPSPGRPGQDDDTRGPCMPAQGTPVDIVPPPAAAQPIDFRQTEAENTYITHDQRGQA